MNLRNLDQELQSAQQRWKTIQRTAKDPSYASPEFQAEIITELSVALEELRVASEELHHQNEQLILARELEEIARQHYQELFELAPDGYVVTDERGVIEEVNDAASALLNVPKNYLMNKPLGIFVIAANQEFFNNQWSQIFQALNDNLNSQKRRKNCLKSWEMLLQPRQKEPVPVAVSLSASYNSEGKIKRLRWLLRDLSEVKQAQQKIVEQAALLDVTTDAIIVQNMQDQIVYWNKGAERLYGWTKEEAQEKNFNLLLSLESLHKLPEIYQNLFKKGQWQGEFYQVNKTGKDIIVESRWFLVRDENNNLNSILIVNTDVTLAKQLEAKRQQNQRLEIIGSLASGISHDLNNILTPILGMAQLLARNFSDTDDKTQQMLKIIEINAQRGASLLKQILMFSRGVKGRHSILLVDSLIAEIKQVLQETFPKTITINQNVPCDVWAIRGDITQLHQVLMNLCLNARDAMPNGGTLEITAENFFIDEDYASIEPDAKPGPYVVIKVLDTGMGIPLEIRNQIFEPFFTNKEIGQGTGLGLSIVMNIVKSHHGFIKLSSDVGQGTQFKVFLPAIEIPTVIVNNRTNLFKGNRALILVVDDEVDIGYTTKTLLKTYDYQVLTANNGIEAIALYAQHYDKIAAVLIDMVMPSMDGASTIYTLQKINPEVKIIATSGLLSLEQIPETLDGIVKAFLPKPYTSEELLTTLQEILLD